MTKRHRVAITLSLTLFASTILPGCGTSSTPCSVSYVLTVRPQTAVVDHLAASPNNQVQFVGTAQATAPAGCPVPSLGYLEYASWSNPDTTNIEISSARDQTNGTATCKGTTNGAVVLTGTFTPITVGTTSTETSVATVSLTCR